MKKLILTSILLSLAFGISKAESTVYFTRDSLASTATYYVLMDRSLTIGGTYFFSHDQSGTSSDMYVKEVDIMISSATTEAKVGWIYSINASSAQICWFDRAVKYTLTEPGVNIIHNYTNLNSGHGLRLSQTAENATVSSGSPFGFPREFAAVIESNTSFGTSDIGPLQIYDSDITVVPAKGDIILKTTSSSVSGKVDIKLVYDIN